MIRAFTPLPFAGKAPTSLYRILISRAEQRPQALLYPFNLPDPIPSFPLPLKPEDPEPIVNLQPLLHQVYDRAAYDLEIDYSQDAAPPLSEEDRAWLDALLKENRLR